MRAIKPEEWESHKNYPTQVLLLGSHENFRRISSLLVDRAEQTGYATGIESLYRRWKSAMRGHEAFLQKSPSTGLADALIGHHDVLIEHLRYEEDLVIPLLLELSADEFRSTFG